ncbi:MAG: phytanoyl-CoA dioxygenase, partial [Gemmatimonadetes bacterium]|nr:phytanoyl-CoA dioxygenase [Gemmatimonadota bacterium]
MVDKQHLLNSKQMAQFVADGLLRFDELVPDELNRAACAEMEAGVLRGKAGVPMDELWQDLAIGQVIRLPAIQGMIDSLVGPGPLYDHHAVHTVNANHEHGQIWHADAIIDTRMHFDVQFFYFAHDTPREMGGTMFLPGSQYRRVSESDIARYQNFLGQMPMVCKAGTVAVAHHGIWH